MKTSCSTSPSSHRPLTFGVLAAGLLLPILTAGAATPKTTILGGHFDASNGDKGTFADTITVNGATTTEDIVLTRATDKATSSDTITIVTVSPTVHTVTETLSSFGGTTTFTSQKTVTKLRDTLFEGTGSYTISSGDSGTLKTLEANVSEGYAVSTVLVSARAGTSQLLRTDHNDAGDAVTKLIDAPATGATTTLVTTRHITSVHHD